MFRCFDGFLLTQLRLNSDSTQAIATAPREKEKKNRRAVSGSRSDAVAYIKNGRAVAGATI
jgi:hypothetical protein